MGPFFAQKNILTSISCGQESWRLTQKWITILFFFCIFQKDSAMATHETLQWSMGYLRFEVNGKISMGRQGKGRVLGGREGQG